MYRILDFSLIISPPGFIPTLHFIGTTTRPPVSFPAEGLSPLARRSIPVCSLNCYRCCEIAPS